MTDWDAIMNATKNKKELWSDKAWLANNIFLIAKTSSGRKIIISGGSGNELGVTRDYKYDTGNGYRNPKYGDESYIVVDVVRFDSNGIPDHMFDKTLPFYVYK